MSARTHLVACVLITLAVAALGAQDLLRTNPNYLKARELQLQAEQAYGRGDYDKASQLAGEAKQLSAVAEREATTRLAQLRANGWRVQAERRLQYAEGIQAPRNFPQAYASAKALYETAVQAYQAADYEKSTAASKAVLAALENIKPK